MRRMFVPIVILLFAFSLFAESPQPTPALQGEALVQDVPNGRRRTEAAPQMGCETDAGMAALYSNNPDSLREAEAFNQRTGQAVARAFPEDFMPNAEGATYVIPVVFHVFGTEYTGRVVNDAIVQDAVRMINEDFQGLTADWSSVSPLFNGVKAPISLELRLAKIDPNGQPTTGIIYYPENCGFAKWTANREVSRYAWDNYKYANVYIMEDFYCDGTLNYSGIAWYPDSYMSDNNFARIVYNGRYIGTNTDTNFRSVLTHEFGHYFNLAHTFEGECSSPNGDSVSDTPATKSNWTTCNLTNETCPGAGIPNGENFMDYSECYRMYTAGQVARMQAAMNHSTRFPLWQTSNLIATGVASGGGGCSYSISPTSANPQWGGGTGSISVSAGTGCAWTATSNASWIVINSGSAGTGNGTVAYSVGVNSGPNRSGTITVAGTTFTVNQSRKKGPR